jgi:KUP system potassium uptake protein
VPEQTRSHSTLRLAFLALGVVYGDIGTSPLYAIRECFAGTYGVRPTAADVLGVLSLVVWSLVVVVSVKYLALVMRADNRGEGGILALLALLLPRKKRRARLQGALVLLGLFGAALLYGDGVITPAISVLSAVEGLEVAAPGLGSRVVPLALAILVLLFLFQRRGTASVGAVFSPVMVVWFAVIALLGLKGIALAPRVLAAVNPLHAWRFFVAHGVRGLTVLGAVVLVVTGAEALYADMGHFGRSPIRRAWFAGVLPALLLSYFGQGALILARPDEVRQPFFHLAPSWALYPLVVLATAATVIASQAVISGAFSLTRQAIQLGYCPRFRVVQTSPEEIGQIYVPAVNWALMAATLALVVGFRSSANLAAAYGLAVTATMVITSLLFYSVCRSLWGWGRPAAAALVAGFLLFDGAFFGANLLKVASGGWFPLLVGAAVMTVMTTWRRGRQILERRLRSRSAHVDTFLAQLAENPPIRIPGTAIFMHSRPEGIPAVLLHHLAHNRVLHEQVVLMTVLTAEMPRVSAAERLAVTELGQGFYRVVVVYGFMEYPNVPRALAACAPLGLAVEPAKASYYLGRETLIPTERLGMALWREHLFAFMSRNATRATQFFALPPARVVELGLQLEI